MSQFKVGDPVKIRQWDDMVRDYELNAQGSIRFGRAYTPVFTHDMRYLCGEEAWITSIGAINIKLIFASEKLSCVGECWSYIEEMVEPDPEREPLDVCLILRQQWTAASQLDTVQDWLQNGNPNSFVSFINATVNVKNNFAVLMNNNPKYERIINECEAIFRVLSKRNYVDLPFQYFSQTPPAKRYKENCEKIISEGFLESILNAAA